MTDQITVGYDGSDSSSEAVLWSAQEAVARRAPLHIVACWDDMAALAAGAAAFPEAGAVLSSRQAMETVLGHLVGVVEQSYPDLKLTAATEPGPASRCPHGPGLDRRSPRRRRQQPPRGGRVLAGEHRPTSRPSRPLPGRGDPRCGESWSPGPRRRRRRWVLGVESGAAVGGRRGRPPPDRASPSSTVGGTRTRRGRTPPSRLAISHGSTPPACSRRRSASLGTAAEPR